MNYVVLILLVIPCILININLLFAGDVIYNFCRNIFISRMIQIVYIVGNFINFLCLIYFRSVDIWNRIKLKDIMIVLLLIILLMLMTIYTYLKLGEGVFSNGVIFKGILIPWRNIKSYKIESTYVEGKFLLILYIENNKKFGIRSFTLKKEFETCLNKALCQVINSGNENF